jgi:hypothetical protein
MAFSRALHFLIDITCRASPRGVQTTIGEKSNSLEPRLAIIAARVLQGDGATRKNDLRIGKIQSAVVESGLTFSSIKGDLHDY